MNNLTVRRHIHTDAHTHARSRLLLLVFLLSLLFLSLALFLSLLLACLFFFFLVTLKHTSLSIFLGVLILLFSPTATLPPAPSKISVSSNDHSSNFSRENIGSRCFCGGLSRGTPLESARSVLLFVHRVSLWSCLLSIIKPCKHFWEESR